MSISTATAQSAIPIPTKQRTLTRTLKRGSRRGRLRIPHGGGWPYWPAYAAALEGQSLPAMESRSSDRDYDQPFDESAPAVETPDVAEASGPDNPALDGETERTARSRLFDEVLAAVELVLAADGVAFWHEEADHSLALTASRSIPRDVLDALDHNVIVPLQSIMQRWPDSPLVAIPLDDPTNPIAEEIRAIAEREEIVGMAGIPCRIPGEMLGLLLVVHHRPHPWTVRELGLATGFAGQLATAMQNARLYASVRSLANRLTAIHELSLRLAQLRDVESIAEAMVAEVGRLVDCDTVRVYRPDPVEGPIPADRGLRDFRRYRLAASRSAFPRPGRDAADVGGTAQRAGHRPGRVDGAAIDLPIDLRARIDPARADGVRRRGPGRPGGLESGRRTATAPDDEQALSIFGRYAGQAIVNADNIKRLEMQRVTVERQLAGERRLLAISEQLVSTLEPRQVLEQIADTIGSVVHYDRLTIYHHDRERGSIEPVLSRLHSGETGDTDASQPALDEGLTSWVIGRGDAVCANDVAENVLAGAMDAFAPGADMDTGKGTAAMGRAAGGARPAIRSVIEPPETTSHNIIVVPLRVRGEVVGSLNLTRIGGPEAHFSEPEFELSKLFAGQASIALQNAEAHVTVSTRADLDALTGLRNHGTFQRDLQAMIDAGDRFSLLMMDLDSFKAFNDTYGHPAGDALLQTVAKAIVGATRQNDRVYRYGGDEFALLLLGAGSEHAEEVAGRVRVAVRQAVRVSPVASGVPFGASVGVAHWPADGPGKAELVGAADAALYEAKRNRGKSGARAEADGRGESGARVLAVPAQADAAAGGLLEAARDFLAATTAEQVAEALLSRAEAIVGSRDGRVAVLRGEGQMVQLSGDGEFSGAREIVRDEGFWGRVWAARSALTEEGDGCTFLGFPIPADGEFLGLFGVRLPAAAVVSPERMKSLEHLAALAGAAMVRVSLVNSPAGPDKR